MGYYFSKLPKEKILIDNNAGYTGYSKEREDKYMTQIDKNDYRYEILRKIPRKLALFRDNSPCIFPYLIVNSNFLICIYQEQSQVYYSYIFKCSCKSFIDIVCNFNTFTGRECSLCYQTSRINQHIVI